MMYACNGDTSYYEAVAAWETGIAGVDYEEAARWDPLSFFPPSVNTVTCITKAPATDEVWVGTTDGIVICDRFGSRNRHILELNSEWSGVSNGQVINPRQVWHSRVVAIIPLNDAQIWVRCFYGSYLLTTSGDVIQECKSDRDSVELQFRLILDNLHLQTFFPVGDGVVYLPWAASSLSAYDGLAWSHLSIEADAVPNSPYMEYPVRRTVVIDRRPYVVGRGGLISVLDGSPTIADPGFLALAALSDSAWLAVGENIWMIEGERVEQLEQLGRAYEAQGLNAHKLSDDTVIWSCFDADEVHFLIRSGDVIHECTVSLPQDHRWRGFVEPISDNGAPKRMLLVRTSRGLVEVPIHGDQPPYETVRFGDLNLPEPWAGLAYYGVQVTACLRQQNGPWLVGTGVGLARYNPGGRTIEWMWGGDALIGNAAGTSAP